MRQGQRPAGFDPAGVFVGDYPAALFKASDVVVDFTTPGQLPEESDILVIPRFQYAIAVVPKLSVTVKAAVKVPAVENVLETLAPEAVVPSLKLQE